MVKVFGRERSVWVGEPVSLADPLSDVTRRERRLLLGTTLLQIAIVFGGLQPHKIETLGIELSSGEIGWLVGLVCLVQSYLGVAFWYYAQSDLHAWAMLRDRQAEESAEKFVARHAGAVGDEEDPERVTAHEWFIRDLTGKVTAELDSRLAVISVRVKLELYVPLVFAASSLLATGAKTLWPHVAG
jgi:hypothetical protein